MKLRCRWACLTVALLLGLVFACGNCLASVDLSGLSEEELQALRDQAQQELDERSKIDVKDLSDEELQALVDEAALIERDRELVRIFKDKIPLPTLISTVTGDFLYLGMSRSAVETILGAPLEEEDKSIETLLLYELEYAGGITICYSKDSDIAYDISYYNSALAYDLCGLPLIGRTREDVITILADYYEFDQLKQYVPGTGFTLYIKTVDGVWIPCYEDDLEKFPNSYTNYAIINVLYHQNVDDPDYSDGAWGYSIKINPFVIYN